MRLYAHLSVLRPFALLSRRRGEVRERHRSPCHALALAARVRSAGFAALATGWRARLPMFNTQRERDVGGGGVATRRH